MSDVSAKGLDQLSKALKVFPKRVQNNILKSSIRAGASTIAKSAKQKVSVREGTLKKSIKVKARRQRDINFIKFQVGLSLGSKAKYDGFHGVFIEFGTSKMAASPFMRPALEEKQDEVIVNVRKKMAQRLDKEVKKASNA